MKTQTYRKFGALFALPLLALLAIPGEAKPIGTSDLPALVADSAPVPQAEFGFLLDPHAAPVLHIQLPSDIWID